MHRLNEFIVSLNTAMNNPQDGLRLHERSQLWINVGQILTSDSLPDRDKRKITNKYYELFLKEYLHDLSDILNKYLSPVAEKDLKIKESLDMLNLKNDTHCSKASNDKSKYVMAIFMSHSLDIETKQKLMHNIFDRLVILENERLNLMKFHTKLTLAPHKSQEDELDIDAIDVDDKPISTIPIISKSLFASKKHATASDEQPLPASPKTKKTP